MYACSEVGSFCGGGGGGGCGVGPEAGEGPPAACEPFENLDASGGGGTACVGALGGGGGACGGTKASSASNHFGVDGVIGIPPRLHPYKWVFRLGSGSGKAVPAASPHASTEAAG